MINSSITLCDPHSPSSLLNNSAVFWVCSQGIIGRVGDTLAAGGFSDLTSYNFSVMSPSLEWPNCRHWFSQTYVVTFFFR